MIKIKLMAFKLILFLLLPIALLGCGGGGDDGGSAPAPSPSLAVLPSSYDFGTVTPGNSPLLAPLVVEIANNGNLELNVNDITLTDTSNFSLDLTKGLKPCGTASPTIDAGDNCTVEVTFQPTSDAHFDGTLTISSNNPDNPELNVALSGTREPIDELNVKINQVDISSCPIVTAYVSVTDQGGYPVTTLTTNAFQITETTGGYSGFPIDSSFVENNATLSVALAMDYSGSVSNIQDAVRDMEDSVASLVGSLGTGNEAEIIDFGTTVAVAQDFTSNITDLTYAIYHPLDVGTNTALYDAIVKAVDDTAVRIEDRKAVVVITDGVDYALGTGGPQSVNSVNDAIDDANSKGIPVFTVGIGPETDSAILQQIADDTGGQFYEALTSDNQKTIIQQLTSILLKNQYILTYSSSLGGGVTADLTVKATLQAIEGDDTRGITSCP